MEKRSILITGVYGLVGSCLYRRLIENPDYEVYGLDRSNQKSERVHEDEVAVVPDSHLYLNDLSDINGLQQAFEDKNTIIHMAGDPNADASWESVLKNNIEATYNVFEAAKQAGVRRVIIASTIQVSFGYFYNREPYKSIWAGNYEVVPDCLTKIKTSDPVWPINLYGSSKVFGESLARMVSSTTNMSCLCIRLGGVHSMDNVPPAVAPNACTQNDMTRIIDCCIRAPDTIRFEIIYGLSKTDYQWVDLTNAEKTVNYRPQDRIPLKYSQTNQP
jgi:NAD+ dependent glucose-6-phosphate dehydrogenase